MSVAPTSSNGILRLVAGPASAILITLIPLPGLEPAAQATAGIATWMAIWWMTEAVPIPVTSLLPLVAFPLAGVLSYQEAAAPYANHLIFLFMGGFFIAKPMERSGSAWRPGGRTAQKAFLVSPAMTASTAAQTAPAALRAASNEAEFIAVSGSSWTRPCFGAVSKM